MNNFKEEAERKYPEYQHGKGMDSATVNSENYWIQGKREIFISGCDFGYQQGIEEVMRFISWATLLESPYAVMYGDQNDRWCDNDRDYTTAELFEIYKKEQP